MLFSDRSSELSPADGVEGASGVDFSFGVEEDEGSPPSDRSSSDSVMPDSVGVLFSSF